MTSQTVAGKGKKLQLTSRMWLDSEEKNFQNIIYFKCFNKSKLFIGFRFIISEWVNEWKSKWGPSKDFAPDQIFK